MKRLTWIAAIALVCGCGQDETSPTDVGPAIEDCGEYPLCRTDGSSFDQRWAASESRFIDGPTDVWFGRVSDSDGADGVYWIDFVVAKDHVGQGWEEPSGTLFASIWFSPPSLPPDARAGAPAAASMIRVHQADDRRFHVEARNLRFDYNDPVVAIQKLEIDVDCVGEAPASDQACDATWVDQCGVTRPEVGCPPES